jgi:tetratricopeptide (TPR) repeat protein
MIVSERPRANAIRGVLLTLFALLLVCLAAACRDKGKLVSDAGKPASERMGNRVRPGAMWSRVKTAEQEVVAGKYAQASQLIESVFKELGPEESGDSELLSAAHYVRGLCRTEVGDFDGAIADLRRAKQLDSENADPTSYLMSTEALAAAYDYAARHSEAEGLFRELVERTSTVHGTNSAQYGRALSQLGINLEFQERCLDATPVLERAVELLSRVAPGETALDGAWNTLGNCAVEAHKLDDALGHYERAFALGTRNIGLEHPRTAIVRHNLAFVLKSLGRRKEALAHARAAVIIRARTLPADHPWRRQSEALYKDLGGTMPPVPDADGG